MYFFVKMGGFWKKYDIIHLSRIYLESINMDQKIKSDMLQDLISRENYLVVQGNDLAKSFGNLRAFEHKVLDYCFSLVKKESFPEEVFSVSSTEILKFFQLNDSGENYKRVAEAFKTLNENTAIYLPKTRKDGRKSIIMTQLFSYIEYIDNGQVEFKFSELAQPYVFNLHRDFYSFHLRELASIKGKYTLILLKLWEAKRYKNNKVTILEGTIEEWQSWFLGKERYISAGEFKRSVLEKAIKELERKINTSITLTTKKRGEKLLDMN
ncbi:initiator RepB protein [Streptococcus agalactiae ATCC 13813]|nr:initiator RepB protein [Streptococcus agalactiae ATCC 13813]PHU33485.1 RepB family plasmid replication initiator protein [Streptococcus agalactiae]